MNTSKRLLAIFTAAIYLSFCLESCDPQRREAFETSARERLQGSPPAIDGNTILDTETVGTMAMSCTAAASDVTSDGAASYSIALWTPPGRAGIEPSLSLSYSSRGGNGQLGVGWGLSGFSQVSRCKKTWAQDNETQDIEFTTGASGGRFCLDGQRLVAVSGIYGAHNTEYRTEVDTFVKVVSLNSDAEGPRSFKVYGKDGRIFTYGDEDVTLNSTLDGQRIHVTPGGEWQWFTDFSQHVRMSWNLSRVEDRSGNYLTIRYTKDVQDYAYEHRPLEINYTAFASSVSTRSVKFFYEARPDTSFGWSSGFKTKQTVRLSRVEMYGPNPDTSALLRIYYLRYRNDSTTARSLLREFQECDGSGVCGRPTTFEWTMGSNQFTDVDTGIRNVPGEIPGGGAIFSADINGDGLHDILWAEIVSHSYTGNWFYALSTGTGFAGPVSLQLPRCLDTIERTRLLDLNNDGKADLIVTDCTADNFHSYVLVGNGTGGFTPGLDFGTYLRRYVPDTWIADLNGDGLPDLLRLGPEYPVPLYYHWLNTESGFRGPQRVSPNTTINWDRDGLAINIDGSGRLATLGMDMEPPPSTNTVAITVDADGGTHVARTSAGNLLSCGHRVPTESGDGLYCISGTLPMDVNGDGLVDILDPALKVVSFNTGNGFAEPVSWLPEGAEYTCGLVGCTDVQSIDFEASGREGGLVGQYFGGVQAWVPTTRNTMRVQSLGLPNTILIKTLDVNGDGLTDFLGLTAGSLHLYIRQGDKPDLLTRAVDGFGRWDAFAYLPLATGIYSPPPSAPAYPQKSVARNMWVVSQHSFDDGVCCSHSLQYSYTDGRVDLLGRGWIGFGTRRVYDLLRGSTVLTTYDNQTRTGTLYLRAGLPRTVVFNSGHVVGGPSWKSERAFDYTVQNSARGQPFIYTSRVHEDLSESPLGDNFVLIGSSTQLQTQDGYGNAVSAETQADVIASGQRTGQMHRRVMTAQYDNSESNWLIGLQRSSRVTSTLPSGRSQARSAEFDYYPVTGLLQEVRREPQARETQPELFLQTVYERDTYGLVHAVERRGSGEIRREQTEFAEPDHVFPTSVTNSAGHATLFAFHAGYGVLGALDDANGVRTRYRYDRLGRFRVKVAPDNSDLNLSYGADGALLKVTTRVNGGSEGSVTYDRLGRSVVRQWKGFNGTPLYSENEFDRLGNLIRVSNPHLLGGTPVYYRFAYDLLGRPTRETRPDDKFRRHEYHGLETIHWDFKNNESRSLLDDAGHVVKTSQFVPSPRREIATRFEYGPFDVPEGVVDALNNRLSAQYDLLGRRTALDDPDSGHSTSQYDAFGQVLENVEADASHTSYRYDSLGRPLAVTSIDGLTTFDWDTAPNGMGRLASSTSADGVVVGHAYDSLGRVQQSAWLIESSLYAYDYTYDAFGRPKEVAYPSAPGLPRLRVEQGYNASNYLETVKKVETGFVYWQALQTNLFGQLTRESFGNGTQTFRDYSFLGDPHIIETSKDQVLRQWLSYGFDENGNLILHQDSQTNIAQEYRFDFLNRLESWRAITIPDCGNRCGPGPSNDVDSQQRFSYDDIGNLLTRTMEWGVGENVTYQYGSAPLAGPHAVTHSSYGDYTYNEKGNQLTGPGRTVQYTAFNLPKTISGGGTQLAFRYDASHRRVLKRNTNGDQTLYIGDLYEKRTTQGQTMHVFYIRAGGRTVAQVQRVENDITTVESTQYLHPDALGTVDTVTDESGNVAERREYEPFGGRRNPLNPFERLPTVPSSDVHYGFTFQEHDDEFGLINMRGRIYEPDSAHFLTPDPYVSHPFFGQSYNRYAYVLNNPTTLVDPSGFEDCGPLCLGYGPGGGHGGGSSGGPDGGGGGRHPGDNNYCMNNPYRCSDGRQHPSAPPQPPGAPPSRPPPPTTGTITSDTSRIVGVVRGIRTLPLVGLTVLRASEVDTLVGGISRFGPRLARFGAWLGRLGPRVLAGAAHPVALVASELLLPGTAHAPEPAGAHGTSPVIGVPVPTSSTQGVADNASPEPEPAAGGAGYLDKSGGRWGGFRTRLLNDAVVRGLKDADYADYRITGGVGLQEEWIPGPNGGTLGGTFVDITATNGINTIRIQTVTTLADGTLTPAEEAAAARIRAAFPNDELILIPK